MFIADKNTARIQHVGMLISCPHCHANYDIESSSDVVALLCHRCGVEFSVADQAAGAAGHAPATTEDQTHIIPPRRKTARIWPWLMIMLTLMFSTGFWLQYDAWLDNRWLRSTAINLGIPMQLRDKDWSVIPDSVRAEWVIRDNASKALLIRGRVKNLLTSDLPAPDIEVIFFSDRSAHKKLGSQRLSITLHPAKSAILSVPYVIPDKDTLAVMPDGEREFVFLIESMPEDAGDFELVARVR